MHSILHKVFREILAVIHDMLNQKNPITANYFIGMHLKIISERRSFTTILFDI